jgi:hypothetical protein
MELWGGQLVPTKGLVPRNLFHQGCILEVVEEKRKVKPRDSGRWTRVSCGGPPSEIKKKPPHPTNFQK